MIFSKRYAEALRSKQIEISLPTRVRKRLWYTISKRDDSWEVGFNEYTSHTEKTTTKFLHEYGADRLMAYGEGNERVPVDLEGFVMNEWPGKVMDAVELFYAQLKDPERSAFQTEANRILFEERQPWQLTDGRFFRVDSEFLAAEVLRRAEQLMKRSDVFAGALDEFTETRNDVTAAESKDAIQKACNSYESAMKAILGLKNGNASVLLDKLVAAGFLDDLPEHVRESISKGVLTALPTLGNKLGRHGQGDEIVEVPPHYGELALNLAASFLVFMIRRHTDLGDRAPDFPPPSDFVPAASADDDIAF